MQEMRAQKASTVGKWGHHTVGDPHFDPRRGDYQDSSLSGLHLSAG